MEDQGRGENSPKNSRIEPLNRSGVSAELAITHIFQPVELDDLVDKWPIEDLGCDLCRMPTAALITVQGNALG